MNTPTSNRELIFIIEDDAFLSTILTSKMSQLYTVRTFPTAEEMLTVISEETPSLILLDIYLPGLNGLDALEQLRASTNGAKIPVIVISNTDDPKDRDIATKLGAHFMVKALTDPGDIMKKVTNVLEASYSSK